MTSQKRYGVFALSTICVQCVLLMNLACRDAPLYDEIGHLSAGLSHWDFGSFDLYNATPPLVRTLAALAVYPAQPKRDWKQFVRLPGARTEILVGRDFVRANGRRSFRLITFARWACIPFALLGGYVCFLWAKELYGARASLVTLVLWTIAPNILANGHLITPDIGATSLIVISGYCYWRWLKRPSCSAALLCGVLLGLTQLTKMTCLVLFALWPAIWLFWRLIPQTFEDSSDSDRDRLRSRKSEARQLAAMLLVATFVLNLGYAFEGSFKKLGDYRFVSEPLSGRSGLRTGAWGNRFSGTLLGDIRVPIPENYLLGIDIPKESSEPKEPKYLLGEFRPDTPWYYYFYVLAVKVPLGTLLLFVLASLSALERRTSKDEGQTNWRDEIVLLAPAAGIFVMVSVNPWLNRQMPDVLPAFPFAFIWMGRIFNRSESVTAGGAVGSKRRLMKDDRSKEFDPHIRSSDPSRVVSRVNSDATQVTEAEATRWAVKTASRLGLRYPIQVMALLVLCWSAYSSLSAYPHSISYFNGLAGGPEEGHRHLIGSSIDRGQDLFALNDWLEEHPEARPLGLAYHGGFDPRTAGICYSLAPPGIPKDRDVLPQPASECGPKPGWYAISVNLLRGWSISVPNGQGTWVRTPMYAYTYFSKFKPVAMAGYSIYIYHITPKQANVVREKTGLWRIDDQLERRSRMASPKDGSDDQNNLTDVR